MFVLQQKRGFILSLFFVAIVFFLETIFIAVVSLLYKLLPARFQL